MLIRLLPLVIGVLPFAGVMTAYCLGVRADALRSCNPFFDGCTFISSTGRYLPESLVFKATLLPQATFLIFFWWLDVEWLRAAAPSSTYTRTILIFGISGAIALLVYVVFLGTKQPVYEFMRRFGIYFYFLGTALAQLLFSLALRPSRMRVAMVWSILCLFALGAVNLLQKSIIASPDNIENRIEWIVAFIMQV